ncbi:hypothetical protein B0J17DRAFT_392181 [Rhizoctonia solani]|nr:hypothetical protein B0J17DRAFT_392181 [Rhizoctonia solani]
MNFRGAWRPQARPPPQDEPGGSPVLIDSVDTRNRSSVSTFSPPLSDFSSPFSFISTPGSVVMVSCETAQRGAKLDDADSEELGSSKLDLLLAKADGNAEFHELFPSIPESEDLIQGELGSSEKEKWPNQGGRL